MGAFTEAEMAYLASQRIGRLATLSADGAPHVVPVRYHFNAALETIEIGGHGMGASKKYRDVARDGRAAFVVDDV
ncbi:MAG: PPOX class F420-dependent oxidoreductase, partial [Ktedonobacterales bacterium]|nr:PPOX class F420-dependent oxidoreductase [Ktedonobacterales bacterium]